MQEIQQITSDVVWNIDRLSAEVAGARKDVARTENRMKVSGSARTVGDVDAELEALDSERAGLDRRKDEILKRQSRLKYALPLGLSSLSGCSSKSSQVCKLFHKELQSTLCQ